MTAFPYSRGPGPRQLTRIDPPLSVLSFLDDGSMPASPLTGTYVAPMWPLYRHERLGFRPKPTPTMLKRPHLSYILRSATSTIPR